MPAPGSNLARIAELQKILESGVTSVTNDGVTVQYDLDAIREELTRLRQNDTYQRIAKPRLSSVDVSKLR